MHPSGSESILTQNLLLASSMLMSIIAFIYTYYTNTKKYELASSYRTEVIKWYSDTILILKRSLQAVQEKDTTVIQRLNADLSAQIEIGRMYFPNINDDNGKKKPLAYKGSRHVILDCLVYCHTIMNSNDSFSNKLHIPEVIVPPIPGILCHSFRGYSATYSGGHCATYSGGHCATFHDVNFVQKNERWQDKE